jgi:hypothetical protein
MTEESEVGREIKALGTIRLAAQEEAQSISVDAGAAAAKEDEALFEREIRKTLLGRLKLVINVFVGIFCIAILFRSWHFLAPEAWAFLSEKQIGLIDTILTSGFFVLLGGIAKDTITNVLPKRRG